ncbi:MAG: hypothetical protein Q9223_006528 [Gallowayella weberi]
MSSYPIKSLSFDSKPPSQFSIPAPQFLNIISIMNNGANRRVSGSNLEGSVDAVWGAVRMSVLTLRDVIMSQSNSIPSPIPSSDGSGTSSPVIPSVQSRRVACTHLTMERLYGDWECMVCHRPSRWGWVYACTQDEQEESANVPRNSIPSKPAWTADLTPWIQEAIAKGHYTAEQIEKMVAQRQKVIDTIQASEAHYKKTQSTIKRASSRKSTSNSTSVDTHTPLSHEAKGPGQDSARQSDDQSATTKLRIFPYCRYRACQLCRPIWRDRTWQVFENAFTTRALPPEIHDIDADRPISSVNLVRDIGTRKARSSRPALRTIDSMGLYRVDPEGRIALNSNIRNASGLPEPVDQLSADLADRNVNTEPDTKGFRDSVKRAFKGMLMSSRKRDSWSSHLSKRSATRKLEMPGNESDAELDLGLWRELSEELLKEAAGVALPGHDGKDGSELAEEGEEVEVEGGVAVTEEAVEMGTADIIMSV